MYRLLNRSLPLALFIIAGLAPVTCGADEYVPPDRVKISTPAYRPNASEFRPVLGTYTYTVAWQGIPAARVRVSCEMDANNYRVVAEARTLSGIDVFYRLRYHAEGLLSASDLSPISTVIDQKENSREKITRISFLDSGEVDAVRQTVGEEPKRLRFHPNNNMLDPFAAAFIARSLPWSLGETKEFDTFNGKTRYLISLRADEKISMRVNGEERDVWVIVPTVRNLTSSKQAGKLRSARIYVTADSKREILQIVSSVFIGSVTTTLESYSPLPEHGQQLAQRQPNVGPYLSARR